MSRHLGDIIHIPYYIDHIIYYIRRSNNIIIIIIINVITNIFFFITTADIRSVIHFIRYSRCVLQFSMYKSIVNSKRI